jgi:hypothetical protein
MLEEGFFYVSGRCCEETNHIRILAGRYAAMCTHKSVEEHIQICIRIPVANSTFG